jgi:uncharacterized membrane protein YcaP (DUF421 family)
VSWDGGQKKLWEIFNKVDFIFKVDWKDAFVPTTSLLEIFIRGTIMYIALFALLRFVLNRQSGAVGITDLLVLVLIADAAQNAMASDYKSITEGVLLVATIIGWSYALDWLGYHFPTIQRFIRPPALPLIRRGQMIYRNMRKELLTEDELKAQLRQQGIEGIENVKIAYMEGDGRISVIEYKEDKDKKKSRGTPERQTS